MQNIAFDRLVSIPLKNRDSHLSRPPSDAANSFFFSLGPKGALERLMTEVGGGDWKGGGDADEKLKGKGGGSGRGFFLQGRIIPHYILCKKNL